MLGLTLTQTNGDNMNTLNEKEARQIAEDTKQFDESVSKIMNLAVTLRQERDKARSDRDLFADWYRKYKTDLENVLAVGTVEEKEANDEGSGKSAKQSDNKRRKLSKKNV